LLLFSLAQTSYTAKTQYRKFETYIPRKGIARPQSQFPHSCERFIYSHDRSAFSPAGKYMDPLLGIYTSKSLTDTWMRKLGLRPPRNSFSGNTLIFMAVYPSQLECERPKSKRKVRNVYILIRPADALHGLRLKTTKENKSIAIFHCSLYDSCRTGHRVLWLRL
jgi:hypothetical protein